MPEKARFNKVNTVDGAIGLQSPVASRPLGLCHPKRSSVNSTLPVSSWCTLGSGSAEALSSLSPWCSWDTSLLLISSLDVPSTTNLKLFFQHLLFCWLFVKFLCRSVQWSPLLFISSCWALCEAVSSLLDRAEGLGSAHYSYSAG